MTDLPVKVTGNVPDKTMGRLGEALADLISPITETTGLIGDSLRFHRERMAERLIEGARAKAEQLQVEVKKVPYKFMVGWIEAATLENEDSPLNDLWENLLVAGMTSYQSYLEMFVNILRELGGTEVKVLKELALRQTLDTGAGLVPAKASENQFPAAFQSVLASGLAPHEVWAEMCQMNDERRVGGFHLIGSIVSKGGGSAFYYHPLYHDNFVAFELLTRERLVEINKSVSPSLIQDHTFELITARLTQLGVSFVRASMSPQSLKPEPFAI
jgi:hypothetical protein